MKYTVTFTNEGFYHKAYFEDAVSCNAFARLMIQYGMLISVIVDGLEITEQFIDIVRK